jgi:hypothetical protein
MELPAVREAYESKVRGPKSKVRKKTGTRKPKGKRNGKTRGGCAAEKPSNFDLEPLRTKSGRKRWLKDPTACDALGRDLPEVRAEAREREEKERAGWYMPKRPGCENTGPGKTALGTAIPTQSDPVVPPAMEAELARLNASDTFTDEGDEETNAGRGREETGRRGWDEEDERCMKEAKERLERREAARKETEQKRMEEENRIWRVQRRFEEPTAEDIALGRDKLPAR